MTYRRWLWLFVAASLLVALLPLGRRWSAEKEDRRLLLAVDWNSIRDAVGHDELKLEQALSEMRRLGLDSLAVSEPTVAELLADGRLFQLPFGPLEGADYGPAGRRLRLGTGDAALHQHLLQTFSRRFGGNVQSGRLGRWLYLDLPARLDVLAGSGVGLLPEESDYLRRRGFSIIPRLYNSAWLTAADLPLEIDRADTGRGDIIIFGGEEVLGYEGLLEVTAAEMRRRGLRFGQVEFSRQKGENRLAAMMGAQVLRVHSIPVEELRNMSVKGAVDRYQRAVSERNVRLCYLRFLPAKAGMDVMKANLGPDGFLPELLDRLQSAGFSLGHPSLPGPIRPGRPWQAALLDWLLSLGLLAGAMLLAAEAGHEPLLRRLWLPTVILTLLLLPAAALVQPVYNKAFALLAAVVFPLLSVLFLRRRLLPQGLSLLRTLSALAGACGLTLVGALPAAALLSDIPFMLGIDGFSGVKAAHLLPLLLLAWLLVRPVEGRAAYAQLWRRPLLWGQALLLAGAAAAGLFYLMRTGNEAPAAVPALEIQLRTLLERLLQARPRTKEFLIGYPAVFLALWPAAKVGLRQWLLLPAAVGQVSLFNSFCHIHTPLAFTFFRSFNGFWLGCLVGLLLCGGLAAGITAFAGREVDNR